MEDLLQYPDRVAEFYVGKTAFVTGGTGFMGKVLIEKLLRCCSGMRKIYILVRPKKGKDPNDRLREIFNGPLFDKVKKEQGNDIIKKVQAIPGDVMELDLGLSPEHRKLLTEEVEILYHFAATIRFDEPLKKAVLLNARGTKLVLQLSKECKKLMVHVHLSTAYCHLHEKVLYEKLYPPPADPHKVIKTVEWMSEDVVDMITPEILGDIPNTYAFTKALGEALVAEQMDNLPVVILRPSIVIPLWKEPIPGWTDNINGPTGLLIGAGKGVIRTMYCIGKNYGDFLPADVAINGIILSTWDYVHYKGIRRVYNLCSSSEYKISWDEMLDLGREVIYKKMPLNGVAWYPGGSMKKSKILHYICFALFHVLPAIFVDTLLFILGYKPILCRVQKRIYKGFQVFEYYANNQWDFNADASLEARKLMNPREKETYKVDGEGMNYYEYFSNCVHAARLYILNEPDDTIPAAKTHMLIMYFVDRAVRIILSLVFLYYLYNKIMVPVFGLNS